MRGLCEDCIHQEVCDFYRPDGADGFTVGCSFCEKKRPHGEWIHKGHGRRWQNICSLCEWSGRIRSRFCPNCGADMRTPCQKCEYGYLKECDITCDVRKEGEAE